MKTEFKCLHSGKCCEQTYTQISLTLGDIKRLADFSNKDIKELFEQDYIGIKPFEISEDIFELELGLTIPCKFRIDKRCRVYNARPLNCRLFPYWILAEFSDEQIKKSIDSSYECIHHIELDAESKKRYKEYKEKIVEILEKEAKLTEVFLDKHDARQVINISKQEGYGELQERIDKLKVKQNPVTFQKEIDRLKITFVIDIIQNIDCTRFINAIVSEIKSNNQNFVSLKELDNIEMLKKSQ